MGKTFAIAAARQGMFVSFLARILLPLAAAFTTERRAERRAERGTLLECLAWCPISLRAAVIFVIAATQVHLVAASFEVLGGLLDICVASLWQRPSRLTHLRTRSGRQSRKGSAEV